MQITVMAQRSMSKTDVNINSVAGSSQRFCWTSSLRNLQYQPSSAYSGRKEGKKRDSLGKGMCECTKLQFWQSTKGCITLYPKAWVNLTIPTHGKIPALTWMPDAHARKGKHWYYLQISCKHPGIRARLNRAPNCVVRNTWLRSVGKTRKVCVCGDKQNIKHCSKIQEFPAICKMLPITGINWKQTNQPQTSTRKQKHPTTNLTTSKEHLKCFPYRWLQLPHLLLQENKRTVQLSKKETVSASCLLIENLELRFSLDSRQADLPRNVIQVKHISTPK